MLPLTTRRSWQAIPPWTSWSSGEGEETLAELLPVILQPRRWPDIRGIAYRRPDGSPAATAPRPLIEDLDSLPPPARHLLPVSRYLALGFPISITTTRGCPNHCIFCLGRRMVGYRVRRRSIEAVMEEIEDILAWGFSFINIADDTFTTDRDRVFEFCTAIRKRRLSFTWSAFARVNTVDTAMLRTMKMAGCHAVSFGIESGNAEMLKRIRKGITLHQVKKAADCCHAAGIRAHASFLAGLPGETPETLRDATALIDAIGIEYGYHLLAPFPGTTVREHIVDYDLEILSHDWDDYDARKAIVRTSAMEPGDLEQFVQEQYRPITERWQAAIDRYREGTASPEERAEAENHFRLMLVYDLLSEDRIERAPFFQPDAEGPLSALVGHISRLDGHEKRVVERVLRDLAEKGYLECRLLEKGHRWRWSANRSTPVSLPV
jgi:anaerobic magnesium-protoporphyrin IX monomethyl ester cyclase